MLIEEPLILAALMGFLFVRGWTVRRLGLWLSTKDTFVGIGLALLSYFVYVLIFLALAFLWPEAGTAAQNISFVQPGFSTMTIVAVSVVNPVFEEIFVCGYVISALQERGHFGAR